MADTIVTPVAAPAAVQPSTNVETSAAPAQDPKLDAFARKERQLRRMQQELAAEKKVLEARALEYETGYIPKSRIKDDFWSVASELGIDYNTLTEQVLNQPNMNDPTTRALMNKLRQLETKQAAAEKAAVDASQHQYQQALKQISNEVKMTVASNPDYETIKETGMQEAVVELIEQTFNNKGYLMDIEEAAKEVEAYLLTEATKMSQLKKLQKPKTEQQEQAPVQQRQAQGIKTLTNAVQAQASPKRSTEKERIARAMAAFHASKT